MGKTLSRIVKAGTTLVAAAAVAFNVASCQVPGQNPGPDTNYAPKASLVATPNPAQVGSSVHLDLTGTDTNGPSDIAEYKLGEDKNGDNELEDNELLTPPSISPIKYDIENITENKKIIGQVTDYHGMTDKKSIDVVVSDPNQPYIHISGVLQDDEQNNAVSGAVKVYDTENADGTFSLPLGETSTNPVDGSFSLTLNKNIDSSDKIYLRAIGGTSSNPTTYTRTIELDAVDNLHLETSSNPKTNPAIRVVPYTWLSGPQIIDFVTHMGRVNFSDVDPSGTKVIDPIPADGSNYLKKWNHGELSDDSLPENGGTGYHPKLKGIQVSSTDFLGGDGNGTDFDKIKTAIRSSGYIGASTIPIEYGIDHLEQSGWGNVRKVSSGVPYTSIWDGSQDGYIERFTCYLNTTNANVVNHEIAHGLLFPGHANSLGVPYKFNSIMVYTGATSPFKDVDTKGDYAIDDPTHQGKEPESNILGTTF